MLFKKYSSLENSYREEYINKILNEALNAPNILYKVQEKIHGANFSIYFDGAEILTAKRTSLLTPEEVFFNHQKIRDLLKGKIEIIFKILSKKLKVEELIVYGELFGGNYNHPEVEAVKGAMKVQKGIDYHPDNQFIAFDIKVNNVLLDEEENEELFKEAGLLYCPTLFSGTLEECLKYTNEFNSTIPALFGLPELKENICEGVVIKPFKATFLKNGERVIIKNKNDKWSEKAKEPKVKKENLSKNQYSEEVKVEIEKISVYITENRLKNVLSKESKLTKDDFGKILSAFNKDIIEDYIKENQESFYVLDKQDQKRITSAINNITASLIRKNFINIIDGNF